MLGNNRRRLSTMVLGTGAALLVAQLAHLACPTPASASRAGDQDRGKVIDTGKILAVVEARVGGGKLVERVRRKLLTLDRRQVALITTLADRVATGGGKSGSDVAFLLLAALVTLD